METEFYVVETSADEIYEGSTMYSDPEIATNDAPLVRLTATSTKYSSWML